MAKYNRIKKDTAEKSAFKKEKRGVTGSGQETPKKGMQQEAPGKERAGAAGKDMHGKDNKRQDSRRGLRPMEEKRSRESGARNWARVRESGEEAARSQVPGRGRMEERHSMEEKRSGEKTASGSVPGRGRRGEAPRRQAPGRETERGAKQKLCPVASKCGGCQWINKGYEEQLEMKSMKFRRLMEPYCRPEPIIPMDSPNYYRNKVHAVFGEDRKHNAISGIYEEKSHRIVPVDRCLIENQKADEIIVSIRELLKSFKIRPYDEDTGRGLLRHVLVRVGHATGQIMVVLVLGYPVMPSKNNFVKALLKLHPEITTMVINVNDKDTSMILGEREQVIYGKGYIEDELCGMTFRISPKSFYQVNPVQTGRLYGKAMEYAGLTGKETVLDAYCGTGTIGMIASRQAGKVLGVELNKDAVRDAVSNAKRNEISNIRFYQADAGEFLLELAAAGEKLDVLFMDPPRSGSSEAFLNAAAKIGPRRIVYISCNPDTLAADLQILKKKGYRVERAVAVDMFPYTDAIEAVCLLSNRKPDMGVKTNGDLEDYYRIKDQQKKNKA